MPTDGAPDDPRLADEAAGWVGAYVHVPFCRSVCPYCDFAVVGLDTAADHRAEYVDALITEIGQEEPFERPLDAVFVGGGTPTSLPAADLGRILRALDDTIGLAPGAEVSIEANPEDIDAASAGALAAEGFNRISLGVQSFDQEVLASLGRRHGPDEAASSVATALESFGSVNVDLIFGTPGESVASWRDTVECALALGIHHLSTYALTVERGTPLSRAVAAGDPAPDPDDQAEKYEIALGAAEAAGMTRYETSNHARPGHACRYNLLTWAQGEYAAFGNGAHRHRDGVRSWNVRRLDRYLERADGSPRSGEERLDPWGRELERVTLGLRRAAGVVPGAAGEALVASDAGTRLIDQGVLSLTGGRLMVTRPLLGDAVARTLLALPAGDC